VADPRSQRKGVGKADLPAKRDTFTNPKPDIHAQAATCRYNLTALMKGLASGAVADPGHWTDPFCYEAIEPDDEG
jgi:hypothetical protein